MLSNYKSVINLIATAASEKKSLGTFFFVLRLSSID